MDILFYALIGWNIIALLLYGLDKWKAVTNKWRISEDALLTVAFLMGAVGAILGMKLFKHKIRKKKFKILVPIALVVNILVVVALFWGLKG